MLELRPHDPHGFLNGDGMMGLKKERVRIRDSRSENFRSLVPAFLRAVSHFSGSSAGLSASPFPCVGLLATNADAAAPVSCMLLPHPLLEPSREANIKYAVESRFLAVRHRCRCIKGKEKGRPGDLRQL